MKKVLCPTDFSSTSLNAVDFAANFCKRANFQLILLNVFTEDEFLKVVDKQYAGKNFNELKSQAEDKLQKICDLAEKDFRIRVSYLLRVGELTDILEEMGEDKSFDYLMMGTTGVSNMREAYIGSNTVKAIERVKTPIICVPHKAEIEPLDYMVYATDFTEEDKIILQELVSFAVMFNSRLKVVHVTPKMNDLSKSEFSEFKNELSSFVSYSKISFHLIEGKDVAAALDHYMLENQADMLILFKKRRTFFESLIHKSISKRMSYLTDYPLMIFKD